METKLEPSIWNNDVYTDDELKELIEEVQAEIEQLKEPVKPNRFGTLYLMVGWPGSGKTTLIRQHPILSKAVRVSHDDIITMVGNFYDIEKRILYHDLEDYFIWLSLNVGYDVVVDRTCLDKETRARFLEISKLLGGKTIAVVMSTTLEQSKDWNLLRENSVPEEVYNKLSNQFEEVELSEGFVEIWRD